MSKKRMMSKQQRLYYESTNKQRVKQELEEYAKQTIEYERSSQPLTTSDPHRGSYFQ